jgi:small-conductance mechanosensitive channel
MPVISAILIIVIVVLAVWLAGLAVVLRGYFRAIPVSAAVVAVCVLLLTGGSAIAAIAAAIGVLIGVPVGLWVLVTVLINIRHAGFAHQHRRRSANRAAVRQAAEEGPTDTTAYCEWPPPMGCPLDRSVDRRAGDGEQFGKLSAGMGPGRVQSDEVGFLAGG